VAGQVAGLTRAGTSVVAAHSVDTMTVRALTVIRAAGAQCLLRHASAARAIGTRSAVATVGQAGGTDADWRTGAGGQAGPCPIARKQSAAEFGIGVEGMVLAGANMPGNVAGLAGADASAVATDAVHAMARDTLRIVLASG
jgi:hypothetical protein